MTSENRVLCSFPHFHHNIFHISTIPRWPLLLGGGVLSSIFLYSSLITHALTSVQECEDLRKENKFLANEIHMERIMMRTENELIMRNLRNLNQELQAEVKEVRAPDFCPVSPRKVCFCWLPTQRKGRL